MRRKVNKSFEDLVNENIQQLLKDEEALERIERKVDERYVKELQNS